MAMPPPPHLPAALAGEDCLWYLDRNGSWHPGFNCEFTFCCGTCYHRYCCRDLTLLITERQQKHCLAFRWAPASTRVPSTLLSGALPGPPLLPVCLLPLSTSTSTAFSPSPGLSLGTKLGVSAGAWEVQERHLSNPLGLGGGCVHGQHPDPGVALWKKPWQEGRRLGFNSQVQLSDVYSWGRLILSWVIIPLHKMRALPKLVVFKLLERDC